MQEFDAIYAEGGYFNLTVHPRVGYGSGSPARVAIVEKLIEYIKRHDWRALRRHAGAGAMVPETPGRLATGLERPMNAQIRPVAVTVNLQGKTVELQQLGEDALFGRASYGKYAYAVGCERLFGLLDRHCIKATVFVPGAEAEANPDYVAALARRGHEIAAHGWAMERWTRPVSTNAR
jgi:peptidoglycan/xylan/chitin deacetylase (PgdA/CDA1 family)